MDFLAGRILGPYELQERLGAGGMGLVYRGLHRRLGQYRAIKVLPPHLAEDPALVARFEREARLAADLRHPNIVPLYDVGDQDGLHYLVMELLVGRSLRQVVAEDRPLDVGRTIGLLSQLAAALDYAHGRGVIHRDVKPANVFVSLNVGGDEHVTLVDFGIAIAAQESRLTGAGQVVGTAEYLAPEVVSGHDGGPSSDHYALGIIAYEMLTGRVPFTGTNTHAILMAQVQNAPPPLLTYRADLPPALQAVVLQQLDKRPERRFSTATAFVTALGMANGNPAPPGSTPSADAPTASAPPTSEGQRPRHTGPGLDDDHPTPRPDAASEGTRVLPTPPPWSDERRPAEPPDRSRGRTSDGGGIAPDPAAGRGRTQRQLVVMVLVGLLGLGGLGAGASVAVSGRSSIVARAVLGPLPTATPAPTATPVPTATSLPTATTVPTATPIPAPRLDEFVGSWSGVSSTRNNGPATPEARLKIAITSAGDRAISMAPAERPNDPIRFDLDRADGQTLVGMATSGTQTADATFVITQDRRTLTMTLRPRPGASGAGETLTLILQRN